MKKIKVMLVAMILAGSMTACVPDEFDELEEEQLLELPNTDPDDEDERLPYTNSNTSNRP